MMEEDRRGTSPRIRASHPTRGGRGEPPPGWGVTGVQAVICAVVLLGALLFKFWGGDAYAKTRASASAALGKNITMSEVRATLGAFTKGLTISSSSRGSSSSRASSGQTSSAASSSSPGAASSASHQASSAASGASTALSAGDEEDGAGGEDIPASDETAAGFAEQLECEPSGTPSVAEAAKALRASAAATAGLGLVLKTGTSSGSLPTLAPEGTQLSPVALSQLPTLPVSGRLTSLFGWRVNPVTKKISFHTGIDLAVAEGTPVLAALPGRILEAGQSAAYGNYILMDNGGGVNTFYGHCSELLAPQGAVLRRGAVVARAGSTGMSTGPHVHFEVRVNGVRVNPLWVLDLSDAS